jgi:uncharacterized protein YndB with AHSA1/START domain
MTARATGRLGDLDGRDAVVFERTFRAPIDDVWAAVTESDRLARWIGTWSGDPASGEVRFRMTAEGDEYPENTYEIQRCEPPRRLTVRAVDEVGVWTLDLALSAADGVTTLLFSQVVENPDLIEDVGPGWDWYLDRLVAAETGGDVAAVDFTADYDPALRDHYRTLRKELGR